jgi:predicted PurR-regulated permease PerM
VRNPFSKNAAAATGDTYIALDRAAIDEVFVAPKWLRDVGLSSWFIVGAALVLCALIGLLALTATIVVPVILAAVIAAVASPVVGWMSARGLPRGAATIIFVVLLLLFAAFFIYAVLAGIVNQADSSSNELKHASDSITAWLSQHGIDPKAAKDAQSGAEQSATQSVKTLMNGVVTAVKGLSGLVFFLAMTLISLIFLLKDGPVIRRWAERHMGVPGEVAKIITGRLIGSLRGYFVGVTIIAVFNATIVGIGAVLLGVPLVATIAVVTFIGAYIPFIGAWAAGAFSVLIAFGAGTETAVIGMIVIQVLANGMLQQMVQPIAYGAALGIHPLAALIATIGGGCLFGTIGLILGAPLVSAAVRITADLGNARAAANGTKSADSPILPPGEASPA